MTCIEIKTPATLAMIPATEGKSPTEWEVQYTEAVWLFLEVTQKDQSQVHRTRLVATAADDAEFLDLARAYQAKDTEYMITRGWPKAPGSALPPPAAEHWLAFTPNTLSILTVTLGTDPYRRCSIRGPTCR